MVAWLFAQLYKNPADYLLCVESLEWESISKLESAVLQANRNKILCIVNKKLGATKFNS